MLKRLTASLICLTFIFTNLQQSYAQDFSVNQLPVPGTMVGISTPFAPLALKGLVVNPKKPLEFQFIVDTGRGPQDTASIKDQANQLVKYFLAGLTIPEGDLWVNLSPYERNRMVPEALGQTDLGRDLLAQDYILKQLTASLIYPEKDLGKEFWRRVYAKAQAQFGTTNVPVNTFNKVWILPDQAQVFENGSAAYVTQSTLKVMLDEDYLALHKHTALHNGTDSIGSQIVRAIILPEIEKEVNTGKNFAPLRQIYQALILAKWYKETIQNGLLDALYNNKNKTAGVNLNDPSVKEQIYERYLKAYKKGVFNYIKEDPTPDGQVVPRKYFSGGTLLEIDYLGETHNAAMISAARGALLALTISLSALMPSESIYAQREKTLPPTPPPYNLQNLGENDAKAILNGIREGKGIVPWDITNFVVSYGGFYPTYQFLRLSLDEVKEFVSRIPNKQDREFLLLFYYVHYFEDEINGVEAMHDAFQGRQILSIAHEAINKPPVLDLIKSMDNWSDSDYRRDVPVIFKRLDKDISYAGSNSNYAFVYSVIKTAEIANHSERLKKSIYDGKIKLPETMIAISLGSPSGEVTIAIPQVEYRGVLLNEGQVKDFLAYSIINNDFTSSTTPLIRAAMNNNRGLVDKFLAQGINIDERSESGSTALMEVANKDNEVIQASSNGFIVKKNNGLEEMAELLIAKGANVDAQDNLGRTPLIRAVIKDQKEIVRLLISKGADVDAEGKYGGTALSFALRRDDKELVKILRAAGAYNKGIDFFEASADGNKKEVLKLLAKGADVNARDESGHTALMTAANNGSKDVVELLITHGANINLTQYGETALSLARQRRYMNIVRILLDHGAVSQAMSTSKQKQDAAMIFARIRINWILNHNAGEKLTAELKTFLSNCDSRVKGEVIIILGKSGKKEAIEPLLKELELGSGPIIQGYIANSILMIGGYENSDVIKRLIDRKPPAASGNLLPFFNQAVQFKLERNNSAPDGYDFNVVYEEEIGHWIGGPHPDLSYPSPAEYIVDKPQVLKIERGDPLPNPAMTTTAPTIQGEQKDAALLVVKLKINWILSQYSGKYATAQLVEFLNRQDPKTLDELREDQKLSDRIRKAGVDFAMARNGGIDLNQINVLRKGKTVNVQFDPAQLSALEQGGFEGFTPVITGFQYISSPFPLLGINTPKETMQLAKA